MPSKLSIDIEAANETISDAFNEINRTGESLESNLSDVKQELNQLARSGQISDESLEKVSNASDELSRAQRVAIGSIEGMEESLEGLRNGTMTAREAQQQYEGSLHGVARAQEIADEAADNLVGGLRNVSANAKLADSAQESLNNTIEWATVAATGYSNRLDEIADEAKDATLSNKLFDRSLNSVSNSANRATASMAGTSAQMSVLSAIAESSSLEFGSLSLNVGSFNIALKQLALQIPAILVGMGAWIALLTSLAAGLMTAVTAMGAFMGAGLVAHLEEVESQSEDIEGTMEALMVVVDSIGDVFYDALQPIMQEGEVDLFIGAVEKAANMLNVVAQFLADNKETFTGFWDDVTFNLNVFLDSMLAAFNAIEDHLVDLLNYLGEGLPQAIAHFAEVAANLLPHIREVISVVRELFNELIGFASIVLAGVTPVLVGLVEALDMVFEIINAIPDSVLKGVVAFAALGFVAAKIASTAVGLYTTFDNLTGKITEMSSAGSATADVMRGLGDTIKRVGAGEISPEFGMRLLKETVKGAKDAYVKSVRSMYASSVEAARGIKLMGGQAWAAAAGLLSSAKASIINAAANAKAAIAAKLLQYNMGRTIVALLASAKAFVANTIASYASGTAMTFAAAAAKALMAALGIGIVLTLAAALWKLVSGGEGAAGVMKNLGGVIEVFKNIVSEFVTPILNIFHSLWGLIKALGAPFMALAEALGLASDKGDEGSSMFSALGDALVSLARVIAAPLRSLDWMLRVLTAIVTGPGVEFFEDVGEAIADMVDELRRFILGIPYVKETIQVFKDLAGWIEKAADWMGNLADSAKDYFTAGLDVEGPNQKTRAAREEQEKEKEEEEDTTERQPNVSVSYDELLEQNMEVNADPEEKETMKRLVKDALNEANSMERRRHGG